MQAEDIMTFNPMIDIVNERKIITHQTSMALETNVYSFHDGAMCQWLARHIMSLNQPEYAIRKHQACIEEAKPNTAPPLICAYCGETHYGVKMQKLYDVPMCWHCFNVRVG